MITTWQWGAAKDISARVLRSRCIVTVKSAPLKFSYFTLLIWLPSMDTNNDDDDDNINNALTCAWVCCEISRPLMKSTWSPSLSRGKHRSAGVLGATRDTITGVSWSEPPCTLAHTPMITGPPCSLLSLWYNTTLQRWACSEDPSFLHFLSYLLVCTLHTHWVLMVHYVGN